MFCNLEELEKVLSECKSYAETLRRLGKAPRGSNYQTLKKVLKGNQLSTDHFTGQAWNKGLKRKNSKPKYSMKEILVKNSPYRTTSKLKKRLVTEGVKQPKCEKCNFTKWLDKPIPLELHHVNGDNTDHRLENIQLLCPNCHALTPNYRGKNKHRVAGALSEKRDVEWRKFRETLTDNADGNPERSSSCIKEVERAETRHATPKPKKFCKICGKELTGKARRNVFCSRACNQEDKSKAIPGKDLLLKVFADKISFLAVGKHFNVSDNTVRKWCKKYNILDKVKV